jgi:predicted nucleic acid-binding protein
VTVLVDTSAWIEFLRGTGSPHHLWLRAAIRAGTPLAWTDPILYELSAGADDRQHAEELRGLLLRGPLLAVAGPHDWLDAAQLYRTARSRGLTVRSSIDGLIAAVAIRTGTPLLTVDRGFEALAEMSNLVIEQPRS